MKATLTLLGALLWLVLAIPFGFSWYVTPVTRTPILPAPGTHGPCFYWVCPDGTVYGPCYYLVPPFAPFNGILPKATGQAIQAGQGLGQPYGYYHAWLYQQNRAPGVVPGMGPALPAHGSGPVIATQSRYGPGSLPGNGNGPQGYPYPPGFNQGAVDYSKKFGFGAGAYQNYGPELPWFGQGHGWDQTYGSPFFAGALPGQASGDFGFVPEQSRPLTQVPLPGYGTAQGPGFPGSLPSSGMGAIPPPGFGKGFIDPGFGRDFLDPQFGRGFPGTGFGPAPGLPPSGFGPGLPAPGYPSNLPAPGFNMNMPAPVYTSPWPGYAQPPIPLPAPQYVPRPVPLPEVGYEPPPKPTPPPCFPAHPFARSPRDFFMWSDVMQDRLARSQRPALVP